VRVEVIMFISLSFGRGSGRERQYDSPTSFIFVSGSAA